MNYRKYKLFLTIAFFVLTLIISNSIFAQFPSWGTLGSGTNGSVNSLIIFNNDLIAAGSFTTPAKYIARYNGYKWDTLGKGTNDTIYALAVYNNKLIAAGSFDTAGGVPCNNIAQWDGTSWAPLGLGANNTIFTVDSAGTYLVIGGKFTTVGGVNCSHIAKWRDSSWSAIGAGVNDNVFALEEFNNKLIIGGSFTMAGTDTAKGIVSCLLDSGTYTAMGQGIDSGTVYAVKGFQGIIHIGGDFLTSGGDTLKRLAVWNDTSWLPIGTGSNGTIRTLDSLGGSLMGIGGSFTNINGTSSTNIIAYGGSGSFAPFGGLSGGTNPAVKDILTWRAVYVACGQYSTTNISRWGLLPSAPELILPEEGAMGTSVTPEFSWTLGSWVYSFNIQVARDANFVNMTFNDSTLLVPEFPVPSSTPLINQTTYFWRVRAYNGIGNGTFSLIRFFYTGFLGVINNNEIPLKFNLYQNYPNPFNPVTKIKFDLPSVNGDASLKLNIYGVNGEKVAELLNTDYSPGKWEIQYDATNLASGIYFCRIEAGPFVQTNKMILLK